MKKKLFLGVVGLFCFLSFVHCAKLISQNGFDNCIELSNGQVRVVLDPNLGGRVLVYERSGKNILYVNEELNGVTWSTGDSYFEVCGGRFDIHTGGDMPKREKFFFGAWKGEITGDYSARMVSEVDSVFGFQLVREFVLAEEGSHLRCTQIMKNVSNRNQQVSHWSRTFVNGEGICLVPLNPNSRLPKGYALSNVGQEKKLIDFRPAEEPNIRVREGVLEMIGQPVHSKFIMDSNEGWLAYVAKENLLFVKKFEVYDDREYSDLMSTEVSIWYNNPRCEIEPFSPLETVAPGQSASFVEDWYLVDYAFPKSKKVDLPMVKKAIVDVE